MKLFFAYLKEHVRLIAAFVLAAVIFAVSFALYERFAASDAWTRSVF